MSQTLEQIAQKLKDSPQKVQLIYAFNGVGKTRLSKKFKSLISPKEIGGEEGYQSKVLYYNAFTEDLFFWDNDLDLDSNRKLVIRPNAFTHWVLNVQGQDPNIISNFQYYTNDKLTPRFNEAYTIQDENGNNKEIKAFSEVTYSIDTGDSRINNVKISKGEESNFIWCVFFSFLEQVIEVLNMPEPVERDTNEYDHLEYIFIDDPVSSLDDTHLIELAVNIASLIKSSQSQLKFIITTHNPLFYNVLFNEFNNRDERFNYNPRTMFNKHLLERFEDGTQSLTSVQTDSPFSYHIYLLSILKDVAISNIIEKYHFNFLRNVLEKTATFLGYKHWGKLLTNTTLGDDETLYVKRILNFASHSKYSGEETLIVQPSDKTMFRRIVKEIMQTYKFNINVDNITI
jgi:wobble nucleotide-excising tRNase